MREILSCGLREMRALMCTFVWQNLVVIDFPQRSLIALLIALLISLSLSTLDFGILAQRTP